MKKKLNKRSPGFTLVEMLVVITIMALILGVAIGSFSGMGTGTRINAAFDDLTAAVRYARMYAIGNSQKTYLVFFGKNGETANDIYKQPRDYYKYYRGYTVFAAVDQEFVMEQKLLPPGLIFSDESNDPDGGNGVSNFSNTARLSIRGFESAGRDTEVHGVAFMPDGTIEYGGRGSASSNNARPFWINFTEGYTTAEEKVASIGQGGSVKMDHFPAATGATYSLKVNPLVGHVERREFTSQ